jgi:hypothetical protein
VHDDDVATIYSARRIYGATRERAVLPRGWLNSKVPDLEHDVGEYAMIEVRTM